MGHCPDDTAGRDAGSDFHLIPTISSPQTSKARRFPSPRRPNRVGKGSRDRPSASLATSDPSWCDGRPKGGPNRRCRSGKMGPSERQRPIDGPHSRWAAGLSGCWPWGRRNRAGVGPRGPPAAGRPRHASTKKEGGASRRQPQFHLLSPAPPVGTAIAGRDRSLPEPPGRAGAAARAGTTPGPEPSARAGDIGQGRNRRPGPGTSCRSGDIGQGLRPRPGPEPSAGVGAVGRGRRHRPRWEPSAEAGDIGQGLRRTAQPNSPAPNSGANTSATMDISLIKMLSDGPDGVLERVAHRVAYHGRRVGLAALAAVGAAFDVLLGVVPGAARVGHHQGQRHARDRAHRPACRPGPACRG